MKTLKNLRVLYAEDDEDARFMVTTMLNFSGIEVTSARTVAEAWRLAQAEHFDLYLLDSRFPDGCALDLCRCLSEYSPQIPVLFYAGDAFAADVQTGLDAGAEAYLIKPYFEDLGQTVLHTIEQNKTSLSRKNDIFPTGSRKLDKTPALNEGFVWTPQISRGLIKGF